MYLSEQIRRSVTLYPTLYRCADPAESRLRLLEDALITSGTGFDWVNGYCRHWGEKKAVYATNWTPTAEEKRQLANADAPETDEEEPRFLPYELSEDSNLLNVPLDVEDDWLQGVFDVIERVVRFYHNEDEYSNSTSYPNERRMREFEYEQKTGESARVASDRFFDAPNLGERLIAAFNAHRNAPPYVPQSETVTKMMADFEAFRQEQLAYLALAKERALAIQASREQK